MQFGEAFVETALVCLRAIGERDTCICKRGMFDGDSSGWVHTINKQCKNYLGVHSCIVSRGSM